MTSRFEHWKPHLYDPYHWSPEHLNQLAAGAPAAHDADPLFKFQDVPPNVRDVSSRRWPAWCTLPEPARFNDLL